MVLARIVILCQLPRWRFAKDKRAGVTIDWLRVGVQVQVAMDRLLLALGVAVVLLYVALDLLHMHLLSAAAGGGAGKTTQHALGPNNAGGRSRRSIRPSRKSSRFVKTQRLEDNLRD